MIYCLTGELIILDALSCNAVIDCQGVGYRCTVTSNTVTKLAGQMNKTVRLYTHMAVREDAVELYGFHDTDETEAFKLLITVSGIGPKAGISILSAMTPTALAEAIAAEDAKAISKAQGIGAKTAARVVLELKDKYLKQFPVAGTAEAPKSSGRKAVVNSTSLSDARDALIVLGYSQSEAMSALRGVDTSAPTEDIIKQALLNLMK